MKEIKAVIQPHMVSKVVRALHTLEHFPGFTLFDARGQGRGIGEGGAYVVTEDDIDYHRKALLVVICSDEGAPSIIDTIRDAAYTGNKGDGVIIVSQANMVVRIRTNEKNNMAI